LDIRCKAWVTKILFEGKRAIGVTYASSRADRTIREVRARREVILCGGSINTPKLLQLSGIGPEKLLGDLGISVVHHSPGVGQNLQDHYGARAVARIKNARTANDLSRWPYLGWEILKWLAKKPSIVSLSSSIAYVFWKSDPVLDRPDLQFVLTPISFKAGQFGVLEDYPGMSLGVWPHRPASRGFVQAKSTDPFEPPAIQPNYLSASSDQRTLVEGLKLARKFLATPELSHFVECEQVPGPDVISDDEMLSFARQNGSTIYHFVGSSRMGPDGDQMAVVSSDLRVRGLQSLRVVDASVIPTLPSANTYATTLAIAEKAADMIRSKPVLRAAN
jgi:choline dehydrogenase